VHKEEQQYRVDVSYPEIAGAVAFNAAVRQIVDPLLATLKNAHDLPGYLKSKFTANTLKNGTVSVLLEWEQYYRGAAHPALEMASVNYDTHEGRVLALADLFGPGVDYLPTLSRLAIAKLERQGRPQELTSPEWIRKGAGPAASNFKVFTLTDASLVLHFAVYQVAAGAAGPQRVVISLDTLGPLRRK
jgi:hypothetical protein